MFRSTVHAGLLIVLPGLLLAGILTAPGCSSGSDAPLSAPAPNQTGTDGSITVSVLPQDQTVIAGQTASFRVAATSPQPITYQWQRNGADIAGATSASYTMPATRVEDDQTAFSVMLSTSGSATTATAMLRVYGDLDIPPPQEYSFDPAATDPAVSSSFGDHYAVVNRAVSSRQKLLVFLPGTGSGPGRYLQLMRAGANNGFHVIGLSFANSPAVDVVCIGSNDADCHGNVHEEAFSGRDASPEVSVDVPNSVENRLAKAIAYLSEQQPGDGWGQYLDSGGKVLWGRIRLSGHSQGGSEAGYIAKQRVVDRACFFSSPGDVHYADNSVASWVAAPGKTPSKSLYGLAHLRDGVIPVATVKTEWLALGMGVFGDFVNIEASAGRFGGSHMLLTNQDRPLVESVADVADGIAFHSMTAADVLTPLDPEGLPMYRFAWQYLCFLD